MKVTFDSIAIGFEISNEEKVRGWINKIVRSEKRRIGEIHIIFVESSEIQKINIKFLGHKFPTDVITFNKSFLNKISGEIYISIDMVKQNSLKFSKNNFKKELNRVIVHGILHLLGYNDKNNDEKNLMRKKENEYLSYLE